MSGARALVIDDEPEITRALRSILIGHGFEPVLAATVAEGLDLLDRRRPDVVLLDLVLPDGTGLDVTRAIREERGLDVPIIILSAHGEEQHKVRALDLGADDYLTKPFDHMELLARLRALVRRGSNPPPRTTAYAAGEFSLDFSTHEVRVRDKAVKLTSTEYRLLEELVRYAGTVLPHQFLLERVWGPEYVGNDHYLKVFVRRLRQKLGDDHDHPRYIQTEWGTGYRFLPPR